MKRSYQGRDLPRPDEDIDDQGLAFDIGTLLQRRHVLGALGLGATGFLAACSPEFDTPSSASTSSSSLSEIPEETAGPYPGDGSNGPDILEQSGVVRSDIRSSFGTSTTTTAEGVPLTIRLNVVDMAEGDIPFEGAAVYLWHATRDGKYSMYSSGLENENYLRGVQIVDAQGNVSFTSVFPACYDGRWPHIHFEVYPSQDAITEASNTIATSQIALPQDACDAVYATTGYEQSVINLAKVSLDSDNVFGDDSGASQLGLVSGGTSGYDVFLQVGVDTSTEAGGASGGAPAGESGPGGGTPPTGGGPGGTRPSGAPDGARPSDVPTASSSSTTSAATA